MNAISKEPTLQSILDQYEVVFKEGLDTLKNFTAKIYVDPTVKPRFFKARPVTYALRSQIESELDRQVEKGTITPISFSEWAAPIVPVMKNDKTIRICGDFRVTINQASKLDQYPIPKVEDLFSQLSGGKTFTKLDMSQAYQQLLLDEDSQNFVVVNTHKGLFKYKRLPFGVSSAPGIFQRVMDTILKDIPHVIVYLDDILITGASQQEHLQILERVLSRLKEVGLRLNRRKCLFLQPSVTYLGYRIDAEGLHPTECKIQAINNAPRPQNLTDLKSYLGLLTYYGKFIPNMSTLLAPLYQLLKSSTGWQWTEKQEETFQKSKKVLTSSSVLTHFDTNLDIILSVDVSAYGVGAILAHKMPNGSERPVAFASRTLSCSEKNYSQIEKEALACVFGVKKFHQYLYGHHFTLITDHKPLIQLLNGQSAISTQASARIQHWTLTLSSYEYSIIFRSSEENANADAMSQLPVKECVPDPPNPADTVLLLEHLESSPVNVSQIWNRTRRDPLLSRVYRFVMEGCLCGGQG